MAPSGGSLNRSDSLGATAVLIHGGAIILTAAQAINTTSADAYLQLFDAAAAADVTVGTTIPDWVVMSDFGAGLVSASDGLPTDGLSFRLGLVAASTTTPINNAGATQHARFVIF